MRKMFGKFCLLFSAPFSFLSPLPPGLESWLGFPHPIEFLPPTKARGLREAQRRPHGTACLPEVPRAMG